MKGAKKAMNPKFYSLPQAKQEAIIQAGFRVFGQHTYKKAPMSAIADAAGISKPLLFHYFHNKKELYFFLFDLLVQQTENVLKEGGCYETLDFFELFKSVTQTKVQLARLNPDWLAFSLKTYYEQDPEIMPELAQRMKQVKAKQVQLMDKLDMSCFRPDIDFQLMYKDMTWAAQGYLWEHVQRGSVDPETIEAEFNQLIDFWKSLYLRKE